MPYTAKIHVRQLPGGAGWRVYPDWLPTDGIVKPTAAGAWEIVKVFARLLTDSGKGDTQVACQWHPINQLGRDVVNQIKARVGLDNLAERN